MKISTVPTNSSITANNIELDIQCEILNNEIDIFHQIDNQFIYEGFFGFLNVSSDVYIVFIKASIPANYIYDGIREITQIDIQPIVSSNSSRASRLNSPADATVDALYNVFKRHRFFFSTGEYVSNFLLTFIRLTFLFYLSGHYS
jgi:hypothetical protein